MRSCFVRRSRPQGTRRAEAQQHDRFKRQFKDSLAWSPDRVKQKEEPAADRLRLRPRARRQLAAASRQRERLLFLNPGLCSAESSDDEGSQFIDRPERDPTLDETDAGSIESDAGLLNNFLPFAVFRGNKVPCIHRADGERLDIQVLQALLHLLCSKSAHSST